MALEWGGGDELRPDARFTPFYLFSGARERGNSFIDNYLLFETRTFPCGNKPIWRRPFIHFPLRRRRLPPAISLPVASFTRPDRRFVCLDQPLHPTPPSLHVA